MVRIHMAISLRDHKTKIVATIGPASDSPEMLNRLIRAGVDVARINFSHGDLAQHRQVISCVRSAARAVGRKVAIMADLAGPKMRLGQIVPEPVYLGTGNSFVLTSDEIIGNSQRASVSFRGLPHAVNRGDRLYLNDGLVQLCVEGILNNDVLCNVAVGGELRSHKGLNLPGIDTGISAFTEQDRACLQFALEHNVDAVSQSFVETASDVEVVR